MPEIRSLAFTVLSAIIFFGTCYSVAYHTYLDTSDPLLSHLPHPLHKTHYFANKSNFLNVYFIKRAWGWTSLAFAANFVTSPPTVRTRRRMLRWMAETAVWLAFTSWFFGPALLERLIIASGGECVLTLPNGPVVSVPQQHCFTKSTISTGSHPHLFQTVTSLPSTDWHGRPRLRRGHDVSGHIFLLTMSVLFLADQLKPSMQISTWSTLHRWAFAANVALIFIWLFASYTTSVYFHSPLEKVTGYLLGLAGFAVSQLV